MYIVIVYVCFICMCLICLNKILLLLLLLKSLSKMNCQPNYLPYEWRGMLISQTGLLKCTLYLASLNRVYLKTKEDFDWTMTIKVRIWTPGCKTISHCQSFNPSWLWAWILLSDWYLLQVLVFQPYHLNQLVHHFPENKSHCF